MAAVVIIQHSGVIKNTQFADSETALYKANFIATLRDDTGTGKLILRDL